MLNYPQIRLKKIQTEITQYTEQNDNGEVTPVRRWDAGNAVLRRKLKATLTFFKKGAVSVKK